MKRATRWLAGVLWAIVLLLARPALSQEVPELGLSANLGVYNALIWRGVTFTSRPVLQADATLTVPVPGTPGAVAGGVWTNAEPVAYDDDDELSVLGSQAGAVFTMTNLWGEYQQPIGPVSAAVGVSQWLYPQTGGIAAAFNTTEVYLRGTVNTVLSPTVVYFLDVGQINGSYLEASVRQGLPVSRGLMLQVSALVGYNVGQDARADEIGYFADDGLTHLDFGAAATWDFGSLAVTPSMHLIQGLDDAVKVTSPDTRSRTKVLAGLAIGWSM